MNDDIEQKEIEDAAFALKNWLISQDLPPRKAVFAISWLMAEAFTDGTKDRKIIREGLQGFCEDIALNIEMFLSGDVK